MPVTSIAASLLPHVPSCAIPPTAAMTITIAPSRALMRQFLPRSSQLHATRSSLAVGPFSRVNSRRNASWTSLLSRRCSPRQGASLQSCSYATAAPATQVGRAKAHTGRVASPKRKPAAKKPVKKKAAKKAKAKPKTRPRRVLSEKAKAAKSKRLESQKLRTWRETALLHPPKKLPYTAYQVLFSRAKDSLAGQRAKDAAQNYKNLSAEEHEALNHIATENKAKNDAAYKSWLSKYTPLQIKEANNARNRLSAKAKAAGAKKTYRHIQDGRIVTGVRTPYIFFTKARFASGDMKGMKIGEISRLIGREWKGLTEAEKKPYLDMAAEDRNRYLEEYKTVYGVEAGAAKKK